MSKKILLFCLAVFLCFSPAQAQEGGGKTPFKSTPYPVPRFVSLGEDKIHVRTGPGEIYPISWIYEKKGLPVEIILEYEHWRKIRDHEGQEGWVYGPLLSGRRMGIVIGQDAVALRKKPQDGAAVLAYLNPLVITELEECANGWCRAEIQGREGWVMKKHIWGVYPDEAF